jgi:hypothetical protein
VPSMPIRVVHDAIGVVRRRLDELPRSDGKERLHASVEACRSQADAWTTLPATSRNALMTRLLGIYAEVAKLERERPAPCAAAAMAGPWAAGPQ